MGKDVIIACDFSSRQEIINFLEKFGDRRPFLKIGIELYCGEGAEMVRELADRGHKIFLDLKLHDIPNTVRKAATVLGRLGTQMTTVHTAGTRAMMTAAVAGIHTGAGIGGEEKDGSRPMVLGVTQLTSTSEEVMRDELLIGHSMEEVVIRYASNAKEAGLDGVICSPLETVAVHQMCGNSFLTVTPGIRLAGDQVGDQARVTTPAKARELGSDYIVVGRSITAAKNPPAAYEKCMKDFIGRIER